MRRIFLQFVMNPNQCMLLRVLQNVQEGERVDFVYLVLRFLLWYSPSFTAHRVKASCECKT